MKKKQMHSMHFLSQLLVDLQLPSHMEDHKCGNSDFLSVDPEIVRDQLYQLNVHKSMGPHGIHPSVLKEPVNVMAGPLAIICPRSWRFREALLTGSLTVLL